MNEGQFFQGDEKSKEVEALKLWREFLNQEGQDPFITIRSGVTLCYFCEGILHADDCIYARARRLVDSE